MRLEGKGNQGMSISTWLRKLNEPQYLPLSKVDVFEPGSRVLLWHEPGLKDWYQAKFLIAGLFCPNPDPEDLAFARATLRRMLFGGWR